MFAEELARVESKVYTYVAENRVRLPCCVMFRVRKLFPNPCCGDGCDYLERCERAGHYTGFRTAAESRAIREGRFVGEDLR